MFIDCGSDQDKYFQGGTPFTGPGGTLRFGSLPFSYKIPIPVGPFRIMLYFQDPSVAVPGGRSFSVKLNQEIIVDHLDVYRTIGDGALILPHLGYSNGEILLEFLTHLRSSIINAIEIVTPRLAVYRNGLRMTEGLDYSLTDGGISPIGDPWPETDNVLQERYFPL